VLGDLVEPIARRESPHLWAPLSELEAERVAGQALRDGVELTRPQAPFVTGAPVSGLRICLGGPADLATLERGLTVVRQALTPGPIIGEAVV
jgi:DNA-binding transcriptional MocR family regulator